MCPKYVFKPKKTVVNYYTFNRVFGFNSVIWGDGKGIIIHTAGYVQELLGLGRFNILE